MYLHQTLQKERKKREIYQLPKKKKDIHINKMFSLSVSPGLNCGHG